MIPSERVYWHKLTTGNLIWAPLPGPQVQTFHHPADEIFYGGQAGGGKTDLIIGLALTAHKKSIIFRREYPQLKDILLRMQELLGGTDGFNSNTGIWRNIPGGRIIEFGACQYDKDVSKYKGRPHDLVAFDEVADFAEGQFRFLVAWARTTIPDQRVRIIAGGNPPTTSEGRWVVEYWAPWLDETHPNPAEPGELRWFARIDDEDVEVENGESITHNGETIQPRSRTFIPAALADNPYLADSGYRAVLQGLPEPLRSQLLYGDFSIGIEDDPWQVIPTEWVRLAQQRWEWRERPKDDQDNPIPMTAMGVDVCRGGDDKLVVAPRYANWFAPLVKHAGKTIPDGPAAASAVMAALGNDRKIPILIDIIGIGSSAYDILKSQGFRIRGINFAEGTRAMDKTRRIKLQNVRAEAYWGFREALDPVSGDDIALPPDPELLADLTAPKWRLTTAGIQIESKEDIKKRLKRSPDCADAVIMSRLKLGVIVG
jgi:hypothetical protein